MNRALAPSAAVQPSRAAARAGAQTDRSDRASPPWIGGLQDLAREHGFEPLRVSGRLPEDLQGVLYRNGPGRFAIGGERIHHWFDGDGAVCGVRLDGGRAWGAMRLVRTAGLEREERAGKRLFGGYGTPFARPIRELFLGDSKNPANTSVLLWQGRLFATCEADKPYEIARGDLSTLGESRLDGALVGPLSAHPHRVPSRRTTYDFGVGHTRGRSQVDVYALPDEGPAKRIASFPLSGIRLNHDFAVTENHLVFAFAPHMLSLVNTVLRRQPPVSSAAWRPERGTEIVVIPIDAPSLVRRFRVDAFMLEHVANAYEDGDAIVVDCTHYAHSDGLERFAGSLTSGRIAAPLASELRRLRIRPERESLESEVLSARPVELPRVSPHVEAGRHRFAYAVEFAGEGPFGSLLKFDIETGGVNAYDPGPRRYLGEGVFVPRSPAPAASGEARGEDDGWVLTMVYDADEDRSCLEVLDARAIGDGPIAACHFDHPVPFGFHGAFAPAHLSSR
jgi:all-trans-8'-apo-beta-carotenal 15,15'-oxygenase